MNPAQPLAPDCDFSLQIPKEIIHIHLKNKRAMHAQVIINKKKKI